MENDWMCVRIADLEHQLTKEKWLLRAWKYIITPMLWVTFIINVIGIIYNIYRFEPNLHSCLVIAIDGLFASIALFLILTTCAEMKHSCKRMLLDTKQNLKEISEWKHKCELCEEQEMQERKELYGGK